MPDSAAPDAGDAGDAMDDAPPDSNEGDTAQLCADGESLLDGVCVTPPLVLSVSPENGTVEVSPTTAIVLEFSDAMDTASAEAALTVTRAADDVAVSGTFDWDASRTILTFVPDSALTLGHEHIIEVGTGALASTGVGLAESFVAAVTIVGATGQWVGTATQDPSTFQSRLSLFQRGDCVSGVASLARGDGTDYGAYEVTGTVSGDRVLIEGAAFVGDGATKGWCLTSLGVALEIPEDGPPTLAGTTGPLSDEGDGCASAAEGTVALSRTTPPPSVTAPIPDVSGEWEGTATQADTDFYYRWTLHQADTDLVGTISIGALPGGTNLATYAITGTVDGTGSVTWAGARFLGVTLGGWCIAEGEVSLSADGSELAGTFAGGLAIPDACADTTMGTVALDRYGTCSPAP